jgi:sigma-B regulation protein RsbU (phosphoserine phosphatase)
MPYRELRLEQLDEFQEPEWLARMGAVLEVLNEGVVISDDRPRIVFANSRFVEMIGIPSEELIGFDPSIFYSSQEWEFVATQIGIAFRDGHNRYEFFLPRKGGGRIPVIISYRAMEKSGQRFRVVTFTDISKQVQAEERLRRANTALHKRQMEIEEDLRLAARVQNSLAPRSLVGASISVDVFYHPVHSIGGDLALVESVNNEHLNLLVGDISGHGIGSALVANRIYTQTMVHLRSGMPLTAMFAELNRFLIEDICGSGMFVTAAAVRIDPDRRSMVFAGAGHPPAILARPGQDPLLLESQSMILGALPKAVKSAGNAEVELQPDDRILLYTDGITEVFNRHGEMLDISGVQEIVRKLSCLPAEKMKQGILNEVAAWRDGAPTDDACLLLVHVR